MKFYISKVHHISFLVIALALGISAIAVRAQQSCPPTSAHPPSYGGAEAQANSIVAPVNSVAIITSRQGGFALFNNIVSREVPNRDFYHTLETAPGTEFNAGVVPAGLELVLALRTPEGNTFRTGQASHNPDNFVHANVYRIPDTNTYVVGWEDQAGGGDHDYDDVVLQVCFLPDSDLDGATDAIENAGRFNGDGNGDGIPDSGQPFVSSNRPTMYSFPGSTTTPVTQQLPEHTVTVSLDPRLLELIRQTGNTDLLAQLMEYAAYVNAQYQSSEPNWDEMKLRMIDMQNLVQRQQQSSQVMSNISKMLNDSAMSMIRKIGSNDYLPDRKALPRGKRDAQAFASHSSPTRRGAIARAHQTNPDAIVILKTIPSEIRVNSYFAYGPTPDNLDPHAYEFLYDGTTGAEFIEGGVLLHYVDGQRGDNDLTVNGEIPTAGALLEINFAPTARAHNVAKPAGADCQAMVTPEEIDNGSTDPEGKPLTLTVNHEGPYPIGTTSVILTATDSNGLAVSTNATVTITDETQPLLGTVAVDKPSLDSSDHKMVDITVSYTVSDSCSSVASSLSISSNEPINGTGDGDTAPDWEVLDAHHVRLRAERSGSGSGRVYTIKVTSTDDHNNSSVKTVTVTVPKSQNKKK